METLTLPTAKPVATASIDWKQMWSLTALYASIVIGWIAYQQYQPKLLIQFNFTDFALILAIVQGIILTITPPIAGRLGDKFRFSRGHRFPIISLGISFAAMVFMAVAFTLLGNPGETFRWILPILIVFWLIAMSIFTSPALSTIETFIPVEHLPKAMAILTITANLLYSLEPVIVDIIDYLGAPLTFIAGGAFVFVTGIILKRNAFVFLRKSDGMEPRPNSVTDKQRSAYGFIFLIGLVLGVATALLFHVFPEVLQVKLADLLNDSSSKMILVGVLCISGLLALPFSNLVSIYGVRRSFVISLVLTSLSVLALYFFVSPLAILFAVMNFAIGYAALSVSSLPLAMARSNHFQKVLCVGIFFSGVALPDAVFEVIGLL